MTIKYLISSHNVTRGTSFFVPNHKLTCTHNISTEVCEVHSHLICMWKKIPCTIRVLKGVQTFSVEWSLICTLNKAVTLINPININFHSLAIILLATARDYYQALPLWCEFGTCVIKCCTYFLFASQHLNSHRCGLGVKKNGARQQCTSQPVLRWVHHSNSTNSNTAPRSFVFFFTASCTRWQRYEASDWCRFTSPSLNKSFAKTSQWESKKTFSMMPSVNKTVKIPPGSDKTVTTTAVSSSLHGWDVTHIAPFLSRLSNVFNEKVERLQRRDSVLLSVAERMHAWTPPVQSSSRRLKHLPPPLPRHTSGPPCCTPAHTATSTSRHSKFSSVSTWKLPSAMVVFQVSHRLSTWKKDGGLYFTFFVKCEILPPLSLLTRFKNTELVIHSSKQAGEILRPLTCFFFSLKETRHRPGKIERRINTCCIIKRLCAESKAGC